MESSTLTQNPRPKQIPGISAVSEPYHLFGAMVVDVSYRGASEPTVTLESEYRAMVAASTRRATG